MFLQGIKKCPLIDMSPVDYVSKVIADVVLANNWNGPYNFNVVNPSPYPYHKLFEHVNLFGYRITQLPYALWRQKFLESLDSVNLDGGEASEDAKQVEPNALLPVAAQFTEEWINHLENPVYDQINVQTAVGASVPFPDLEKLVNVYLSYFIRCEFIKPPQDRSSNMAKQFDWGVIGSGVQRLTRTNRNT
jgi:hypothetical protein